jgi:hAT family C-terminal dimerisation region
MTDSDLGTVEPSSRAATPSSSISAFSFRRALSIAEQSPDPSSLPINAGINALPPITLQNKRYVREDWLHKKRKRRSWVGDHGTFLIEITNGFEPLATWWACDICDRAGKLTIFKADSTNAADRHLKSDHSLQEHNGDEPDRPPRLTVLQMQRKAASGALIIKDKVNAFRTLLLQWIVDQNLPLSAVESEFFRDLLTLLSHDVDTFLPKSGDTVHDWLMASFDTRKQDIKRELKEDALSKIHLSFDLWTSPNQLAMLGIVAHYLDRKTWKNQSRLLGLRRLHGAHSGENMASVLIDVAQDYEITDKLGFFTLDNADSNDTCLRAFLPDITDQNLKERRLRCWGHVLNLSAEAFLFGKNADAFEVEQNINIQLGRVIDELAAWRKHGPIGKLHNFVIWVNRTPQRRELFIRISRLEEAGFQWFLLNDDTKDLNLRTDNATRWNSTYLMITRALQKRDEIDTFVARCERERETYKRVPAEDHLSSDDWLILAETASILKPFYTQTVRLQSRAKDAHHGAIWEVLPAMELILEHLEEQRTIYGKVGEVNDEADNANEADEVDDTLDAVETVEPIDADALPPTHSTRRRRRQPTPPPPPQPRVPQQPEAPACPPRRPRAPPRPNDDVNEASRMHLRTAINNAWAKLKTYYERSDDTPVYVAALVLHPGHKWKYVEEKWIDETQRLWIEPTKAKIKQFYEENWGNRETTEGGPTNTINSTQERELDDFEAWITPHNYYASEATIVDEYQAYISSPAVPTNDAIGWWRDHQTTYPKLSQMAFDLLSIPAMSAECERVFSLTKLTITSQRNRMTETTMEAIQCMKNWLDRGAIQWR